jgi:subtilisin-like proprotein convertase family protein
MLRPYRLRLDCIFFAAILLTILSARQTSAQTTFCNAGTITIPATGTSGAASPYPSTINIAGAGTIVRLTVDVNGLTHTFPSDLDLLLVGPGGQQAVLMSDVGGATDANGVDLTFDDNATAGVTSLTILESGTYRPGNLNFDGDNFPAPAPATSGNTSLSVFGGTDPNGSWKLYVVDDATGDVGSVANGWCLTIETTAGETFCSSQSIALPGAGTTGVGSPYPSTIAVTGAPTVGRVTVDLRGLTHTFPSDVDVLLVGPTGASAVLMSDVGGANDVVTVDLRFDDNAPDPITGVTTITSGTYRPGNATAVGDNFPAPAPVPGGSSLSVFNGTDPNGAWSLYVVDDATGDVGALTGGWCLNIEAETEPTVCSSQSIALPGVGTSGVGAPYPSTLTVTGMANIRTLRVALRGIDHTFPADLDIMLVGPAGQQAILMSDVGGATDAEDVDLIFDDDAATAITAAATLVSGTFRPDNASLTGDLFPAPAPAPTGNTSLSVFDGTNPNGTWSLYAVDDATGDVGAISGGWCLLIEDENAPTISCPASFSVANAANNCGAFVEFTGEHAATAGGTPTPTVTYSPASGSFFPIGTTTVTATATNDEGEASCSFDVTVVDEQLPTISVSLSPTELWPANNQMRTINATVQVSDNCPGVTYRLVSVTGNDGTVAGDIVAATGTAANSFSLRAKRLGNGNGRTYTATYSATDGAGNISLASATVFVPHSQGNGKPVLEREELGAGLSSRVTPNPFSASTAIEFTLPSDASTSLRIVDARGSEVARLIDARITAGAHSVRWDGRDGNGRPVGAGAYFYLLESAGIRESGVLMLAR